MCRQGIQNYRQSQKGFNRLEALKRTVSAFLVTGDDPLIDQFIAYQNQRLFLSDQVVKSMDAYLNETLSQGKQAKLQAVLTYKLSDMNSLVSDCLKKIDFRKADYLMRLFLEDLHTKTGFQDVFFPQIYSSFPFPIFPDLNSTSLSILSKKVLFAVSVTTLENQEEVIQGREIFALFSLFELQCAQYLLKYNANVHTRESIKVVTLLDAHFNGGMMAEQRSQLECIVEKNLRRSKTKRSFELAS